jgi:hypothetical protein
MNPAIETNGPVEPEEVLGWQLAGVTQEEIRAEVNTTRMASRPDESLMEPLGWMGPTRRRSRPFSTPAAEGRTGSRD